MNTLVWIGQQALLIFGPLLLAVVLGAAPFFIHKGIALLHINLTAAQEAALDAICERKANAIYGNMVSLGQTVAAHPVVNNNISQATTEILEEAPEMIQALGLTPQKVENRVAAAFGATLVADQKVSVAPPGPTPAGAAIVKSA